DLQHLRGERVVRPLLDREAPRERLAVVAHDLERGRVGEREPRRRGGRREILGRRLEAASEEEQGEGERGRAGEGVARHAWATRRGSFKASCTRDAHALALAPARSNTFACPLHIRA